MKLLSLRGNTATSPSFARSSTLAHLMIGALILIGCVNHPLQARSVPVPTKAHEELPRSVSKSERDKGLFFKIKRSFHFSKAKILKSLHIADPRSWDIRIVRTLVVGMLVLVYIVAMVIVFTVTESDF
jgi:hypothetical protein